MGGSGGSTLAAAAAAPSRTAAPLQRRHCPRRARCATTVAAAAAPRRGVLVLPGLGNSAADYADLAAKLRARGLAVAVAPVERYDWARNALALADPNWWRGTLKPRRQHRRAPLRRCSAATARAARAAPPL